MLRACSAYSFSPEPFSFFSQHNSLEITIGVLTSVMLTAAVYFKQQRENQEEIRSSGGSLCVGYLYAKGVRWTHIKSNIVTYTYLGMVLL